MPVECKTCSAENRDEQEDVACLALDGQISWAEAARRLGLTHAKGLQNHMEVHWSPPATATEVVLEEFDQQVADAIRDLMDEMRFAPVAVKPFYAIAIANLKGLDQTKPSQQHLINALKGIHEVTGMKMEQQMMLDFARHHFNQVGPAAVAAVEQHAGVIDLDEVED